MSNLNLTTGPSSWDRDMQGLDVDDESENLAALGMHVAGAKASDDDDKEEEEEIAVEKAVAATEPSEPAEEEEKKDEPEELDELEELDRLAKVLKTEDDPVILGDEEE